jgi:hypothetical protein
VWPPPGPGGAAGAAAAGALFFFFFFSWMRVLSISARAPICAFILSEIDVGAGAGMVRW